MAAFNRRRRQFLIGAGVAGTGLVIGLWLREGGRSAPPATTSADELVPNAWVRVGTDGLVTVIVAKSEMGQGVHTSLPMLVAEELDVDLAAVRVEQAPSDARYGYQSTGGSSSVRSSFTSLREAGAAARTLLVAAAAARWGVPPGECRTERGAVVHGASGRWLEYRELVEAAARMPVPQQVTLKDPKAFRLLGKPVLRLDLEDKVTGRAVYGIDVKLPGMLTAVVTHCPVFGGRPASVDARKALAVAGVQRVIEIDTGVAVVADNYPSARAGQAVLEVRWKPGSGADVSSESIALRFREKDRDPGAVAQTKGDVERAFADAAKRIESVYELPFQAHATMEPMNCVARVEKGRTEVWAPTQSPTRAQETADRYLVSATGAIWNRLRKRVGGQSSSPTRVHTTLLGGGFGRRLEQDYVAEAVQISKAVGAPIKLVWPREEDIQHDIYRPATYNRISAALDTEGRLVGWKHKIVGPSINESLWPGSVENGLDWSLVEGAAKSPYAIPNLRIEYVMAPTPVPLGFWRSVGNSHNAFVVESFLDEVAATAGADPLEFRLRLLADAPRARAVLELAADKAGWYRPRASGRFLGIAFHYSYYSYVAQVVEVSLNGDRGLRIHRVVCAIDCGQVINADTVTAQMEGSVAFGLSAAIKGEITLAAGRVEQSNFHDYPILRMSEMPHVETYIVPSGHGPGGAGEPGVPPIAPALLNAVYAATGQRLRRLPIRLADLSRPGQGGGRQSAR